ncbi:hypothetical protein NL676_023417 [Syzygium grande]|nr:hypothetical protein NL676_023417 [Syzygium grande]
MEEVEDEVEEEPVIQAKDRDFAKFDHGCKHYQRRCKIRAPCCDRVFACRHCHNEFTNLLSNPKDHHELVRHDVKQVICSVCSTEQEAAQVCSKCGVNMGEYFCGICKFYDDDTTKMQFHCEECGICRVGGRENFFHCPKCGSCYRMSLHNNHVCVENSMKSHCPVCYEYLFDSIKGTTILNCGHSIHMDCFQEMTDQNQYRCPICSKTAQSMSEVWRMLDSEIAATVMPEEYQYEVSILCNDCNKTGKLQTISKMIQAKEFTWKQM